MRFMVSMFVLVLSIQMIFAAPFKTIYVSPNGDDANPGSKVEPLHTVVAAQEMVRDLIPKMKGDIVVELAGGMYTIDETLVFSQQDGGKKKYRVIYKAADGERPIISGGVRLRDWEPDNNGVWKTSAQGLKFRQLYVNGQRGIRARTPNVGTYHRLELWDLGEQQLVVPANNAKKWENVQDIEMVVQMNWAESYLKVESIDFTNGENSTWNRPSYAKITPQEPGRHLIFGRDYPPKLANQPYHFENAREFIDQPGEWYLDQNEDVVYYMPRPEENIVHAEVIVPKVETLILLKSELDSPVKNISFEGIQFSYSTWLRPSELGHLHLQAGQYTIDPTVANTQYVGRPASAVLLEGAHNIKFTRNVFTNLGATALDLHYGTFETQVIGNVFYNISGNAVSLAKFSDPKVHVHLPYNPKDMREVCEKDRIANNLISHIGRDYPGSCGITIGYSVATEIDHNDIQHTPYSGISIGWGWTDKPSVMRDNKIRWNDIHHVMESLIDCGGIYTLSLQPGTEIVENYIHDCTMSPWAGHSPFSAIYLDENSGGTRERPMVIRNNLATSGDLQRFHMHVSGVTLWDNNFNYMRDEAIAVATHAGIELEYQDIKNIPNQLDEKIIKLNGSKLLTMTAELKADPKVIAAYKKYHSAQGCWPEVALAAQKSGIESIKIYIQGNRLFMQITVPENTDPIYMDELYAASSDKIKEWGELMSEYQQAPPGAQPGQIWVPMELIHDYEDGKVK